MHTKRSTPLLVALVGLVAPTGPTRAEVDASHLGAKYDAAGSNIAFRVYSSRATRIELNLYAVGYGAPELAKYFLTKDTDNVWSVTVHGCRPAGRGHRRDGVLLATGPGAPTGRPGPDWTKGSAAGFNADVDASGNRFNPNKLLFDPYALELSQDPLNSSNSDTTVFASGQNNRTLDSGPKASKGIVLAIDASSTGTKPTRAQRTTSSTKSMCAA